MALELTDANFEELVMKSDKPQSNNKTLLQRFGYDIYSQQFPENFKQQPIDRNFTII